MKNYTNYLFCSFLFTSVITHSCGESIMPQQFRQNPAGAIALYFAVNIAPWHKAVYHAMTRFNQEYPDLKFKKIEIEQMHNLHFKFQDMELKIKQEPHFDAFRAKLEGPDLRKEHTSQTPETFEKAIYNMLINHVADQKK